MVSRAIALTLPRTRAYAARLERVAPWRVLATFVVLQWILVLGIARTVRHAGWIYYQGGDQLWYYTVGWLLVHGHAAPLGVGYLWSVLLAPVAAATGANVANAYPAIIVLQFLFLLPIGPLAMYGIGRRLGGRLFGYWTSALWLLVPLVAIKYTDAGYHQRFTEVLLPQGSGLTAMADFPTMLAALVSAYFCVRILADEEGADFDALAGGLCAGAAIAIKPATALFLAGPALAFIVARRGRAAALFAAAVAPAALVLAFVKWRTLGVVPILHADGERVVAAGSGPVLGSAIGHYIPFHWDVFKTQLDQIREHFWSVRLVEWFVIAGALGLGIRSRRYAALVVGWFGAIVVFKTGSGRSDMEGGNLLRVLMPAFPAFVLLLASLPFLFPGLARHVGRSDSGRRLLSPRLRGIALVAMLLGTTVVPAVAYGVATPIESGPDLPAAFLQQPPIPINRDLGLVARSVGSGVTLHWPAAHASGGPVFYHVFVRAPGASECVRVTGSQPGAEHCLLQLHDLGATRETTFVDPHPAKGRSSYYVGVAANWLDDLSQGDVYELGRPAGVTIH